MLALTPFFALEAALTALIGRSDAFMPRSASSAAYPLANALPLLDSSHMLFLLFGVYLIPTLLVRHWIAVKGRSGVAWVSPRAMRALMLIHNATLAVLSGYMAFSTARSAWRHSYTFAGNQVSLHPTRQRDMVLSIGLFYASKILEFGDTFIMLLRGNLHQVSFLHVYHHATVFPIWWLVARMAPTGEPFLSAILNSLVHVVMYSYYFLSALGVKRVSAVKKYLTTFQMAQFGVLMIQAAIGLALYAANVEPHALHNGDYGARYPAPMLALLFVYMISMLLLFRNFYVADRRREKTGVKRGETKTLAHSDSALNLDLELPTHAKSE